MFTVDRTASALSVTAIVGIRIVASQSSIVMAACLGFAISNRTQCIFNGFIFVRPPWIIATVLARRIVTSVSGVRIPAWYSSPRTDGIFIRASRRIAIESIAVVASTTTSVSAVASLVVEIRIGIGKVDF